MKPTTLLAAAAALLSLTTAAPIEASEVSDIERRDASTYDLAIGGGRFNLNELQSYSLFYANSSAYIGQIKYQSYSEPLIVSGARNGIDTITFQSIHSSPTGWQQMYVVPGQSKPVGFSVPHGSPPAGVRTNEFSFTWNGSLQNHGRNFFYACQDAAGTLAAIHSYQIWWMANGFPRNWTCKGPLNIHVADGCARSL
ncbi:uncharacterized protein Z520_00752 [Fonsecaea multimorphosa CBS 102226]|uniref:Uncharacterized protein n=1 Tax=Fonsecaea multimorphosa CBS 102226 TaxID=1442371 RepID=A0A0D2KKP6_9EURO|nr:uncharacterized protein Z520_00752 [Fonsecaea multimorphosa CBS 102226]KIY04060.1 hypothetical protein Z520_00752 [Fonsecaea multimorphosa CBS 102226]OAL31893.1 hypothetical protein AYO22_00763 [Fonsecaea multimorphosa]